MGVNVSLEQPLIIELGQWLNSPPGRYVQRWEQKQIDGMVTNVFGYHAIQIGLPQCDFLQANRIPFRGCTHVVVDTSLGRSGMVVCDPENLPFDSQSIDLLILPHVLECSTDPHQVLREVERVLMPEGRVVISGFNPWSLWGARERIPGLDPLMPVPADMQVSLNRLKDWFRLLSLDLDRGRFGCYAPACLEKTWLDRWSFMEKAGDRWWPVCGAVYVVSAVKRVVSPRLVGPDWKVARKSLRARAVVTGRQSGLKT